MCGQACTGYFAHPFDFEGVISRSHSVPKISPADHPGLFTDCLSRSRLARCRQAFEQYTRRRPPSGDDGLGSLSPHTMQRLTRRRSLLGRYHYAWRLAYLCLVIVCRSAFHLGTVACTIIQPAFHGTPRFSTPPKSSG